jgi:hypothetical protein
MTPNLFVPCDVPDYAKAESFAAVADPKYYRLESDHVCQDGRVVSGIWVPQSWWALRHNRSYTQWCQDQIRNPGFGRWNFTPKKARKTYTDEEKAAFLESAKETGKALSQLKLSPETQRLLREQDERRE